ncbi:hypothetical protein FACS1894141_6130 [Spirochaetia bacterium]|nr:hypothetical protein FACS1894141_6130 [Spirochaetia bacterium]
MKLLLVLGSDELVPSISACIQPLGYEIIRYCHALKAMDNIDEVDPAGIIISTTDFPRHWKVMVQFVRHERSAETCPILLLTGERFPPEDASKAFHIGINGIISETMEAADRDRLESILTNQSTIAETPCNADEPRQYPAGDQNRIGFCTISPVDRVLITGITERISSTGIVFIPANPALLADIQEGDVLSECSLRVGDDILSPVCSVVHKDPLLVLEFSFFPDDEQRRLEQYLHSLPL